MLARNALVSRGGNNAMIDTNKCLSFIHRDLCKQRSLSVLVWARGPFDDGSKQKSFLKRGDGEKDRAILIAMGHMCSNDGKRDAEMAVNFCKKSKPWDIQDRT